MHRTAKSSNVPISVSSYFKSTEAKSLPVKNNEKIPKGILSTENMLLYSLKRDSYIGFCGYLWNKLFRADLFQNKSILFDETVSFGEDALFFTRIMLQNNCTGVFIDKPLYHYSIVDSSLSNSDPLNNRESVFKVYSEIINLLDESNYKNISIWAKRFYCYFAGMYADIARKNGNNDVLSIMQEEIKLYLSEYVQTNQDFPDRLEWINSFIGN